MSTVAIVAALDRELTPLVRNWQTRSFSHKKRNYRVYECTGFVAVAGGIGCEAAGAAARALVAEYRPQVLVSAGVAGATQAELRAGTVITPATIIDSRTGEEYHSESGNGILVTTDEVADQELKQQLAQRFSACAVDMEAAAVAAIAQQEAIHFRCIKAISDEAGFRMPPVNQFVDQDGQFQAARFAGWAALRPMRWADIAALARNTRCASKALCNHLKVLIIQLSKGTTTAMNV